MGRWVASLFLDRRECFNRLDGSLSRITRRYNARMDSRSAKPSLTTLVAFVLVASLYAMSYFVIVTVEHSGWTGNAQARYPGFVEPVSILFRPMEFIDSRIRADLWAPVPTGSEYIDWMDRGY